MTVCSSDETVPFLVGNAGNVVWTIPSGLSIDCSSGENCINSSGIIVSNFNTGINSITVTVSDNLGQLCESTFTIINYQISTADISMEDGIEVCDQSIQPMANTPSFGETGIWSSNTNGVTFSNVNDPQATINLVSGSNNICWTITRGGCTSEEECIEVINVGVPQAVIELPTSGFVGCIGETISFNAFVEDINQTEGMIEWTFPDFTSTQEALDYTFPNLGIYTVTLTFIDNSDNNCPSTSTSVDVVICDCDGGTEEETGVCESTFAPIIGRKYVLSAWVKGALSTNKLTYENVNIELSFGGVPGSLTFFPEGGIIDGWQRIEEEFVVPTNAATFNIRLNNTSPNAQAFFDDIRMHPFDANMKSFVYDPLTLRLSAELDERNYATYYEYDEEGALIRVKKETERGIMTIQEGRNAIRKIDP